MFYVFSKTFWTLAQPLNLFVILFAIGLGFHKRVWGQRLLAITAVLFIACGVLPIGPVLIRTLEKKTSVPVELPKNIDGIIVLGGAVNAESSQLRGQVQINEWSERLFEMMRLSRIYPQAKVVYSGGAGSWHGKKIEEADIVHDMLNEMKISDRKFIFESQSRTTYENAVFSKNIIHPKTGENWLLITSAFHMPRARAVFEKQGWNVIPYPAGFIENGPLGAWQLTDVSGNYWKLNVAAKEIMGLIAYRLSGRI